MINQLPFLVWMLLFPAALSLISLWTEESSSAWSINKSPLNIQYLFTETGTRYLGSTYRYSNTTGYYFLKYSEIAVGKLKAIVSSLTDEMNFNHMKQLYPYLNLEKYLTVKHLKLLSTMCKPRILQ